MKVEMFFSRKGGLLIAELFFLFIIFFTYGITINWKKSEIIRKESRKYKQGCS